MIEQFIQSLQSYELTTLDWSLFVVCAVFWGLSKSGLKGVSTIAVPVMAYIFGSKASTGLVVPMLIFADVLAVIYYNRHAQWKTLFRILPWTMVGVIIAGFAGDEMDENTFRQVMAVLILGSVIIVFWWEYQKSFVVPTGWWFAALMGIIAGVCTMIGNVAGAIVTIYLLAMRFPKDQFIGTGAWFFMIINTFKLPMHIFVWKTVSINTLSLNVVMLPIIVVGFIVGALVIKKMNDDFYRKLVLVMTAVAAVFLFLR